MFKLKVEILSKSPERLAAVARLLNAIHCLSGWGASRTIKVFVDGDGASDIKCEFPELNGKPDPLDEKALEQKYIEYFID